MRYVTSVERIGMERGLEKGRQEGEARTLLRLLERRFGRVSDSVRTQVMAADLETLDLWFDRGFDAPTLDAVFDEGPTH